MRRLTAEDLLELTVAGDVQLTPAGVLYTQRWINKEKNQYDQGIYLAQKGQAARRFTGADSDHHPRLSPDGETLAFLSKRSGQMQIWLLPMGGGEAKQLTKVQGGVNSFVWSLDSQQIAFEANLTAEGIKAEAKDDDEQDLFKKHTKEVKVIDELVYKFDGIGYYGEARPELCVIALADETPRQLTTGRYPIFDYALSADGAALYFTSQREADFERRLFDGILYKVATSGGDPVALTDGNLSFTTVKPSPDGKHLALIGNRPDAHGYDNPTLYVMAEGQGPVPLLPGFDRPVGSEAITDVPAPSGGGLTWSADGQHLYFQVSDRGTVQLCRASLAGELTWLTKGDRVVYSYSTDGRQVALGIADYLNPSDLYLLDLAEGQLEQLTELNAKLLGEVELSMPERFTAQAAGGPEIDGWVMKPAGFEPGERYPTVLFIHGGPMGMYGTSFFFEMQLLCAEGYGVIFSNPRGSLGYGEAFCMAIQTEWGNRDYQDLMAITDQAIEQFAWIDPDALGVTGGSYGGYMTNWIVSHTDRFKAAVTGRSVVDFQGMVYSGDVGVYWPERWANIFPWQDDRRYKQQSPLTYVEQVTTPILIEHQEMDLRCPIDQAEAWYTALRVLGKAPVKFVRYPGEFHGMSRNGKPYHRLHRLKVISDWFQKYLS